MTDLKQRKFASPSRSSVLALVAGLLFIGAFTGIAPARAQDADTGDSAQRCGLSRSEMLQAIDGKWTFKQGAGVGVGGVLPFPLPAHRAQKVRFEFDEEMQTAVLKHDGQKMAMLPVEWQFARHLDLELTSEQQEALFPGDESCGWASVPVLAGSTHYDLVQPRPSIELLIIDLGSAGGIEYCKVEGESDGWLRSASDLEEPLIAYETNDHTFATGPYEQPTDISKRKECEGLLKDPSAMNKINRGDMLMTLVLNFTSADSATGYLDFRGQTAPRKGFDASLPFVARAMVTLTR